VQPVSVVFDTAITINTPAGYIQCGSSNIVIGNITNASRAVIAINGIQNYPGFVQNGSAMADATSNVTIANLFIASQNSSTLAVGGGWVAQQYFGTDAENNTISNCGSDGDVSTEGGGIVGAEAKYVTLTACTSSAGNIEGGGGGIVGGYTVGVSVSRCSSSGYINSEGGGIVGVNAASAEVTQCYSTGVILGDGAGGIIGAASANCTISACYSRGIIGNGVGIAGGILGSVPEGNLYTITNCYSSGSIDTGSYGIVADVSGAIPGTYVANNTWNDDDASFALTGVPAPYIGTTWSIIDPTVVNQPYILTTSGYSPYSATGADSTIVAIVPNGGGVLPAPVITGYTYSIIAINDSDPALYPGINMGVGGVITFDNTVLPGEYTIYVYCTINPYNITEFNVTLESSPPPVGCCSPLLVNIQGQPYETITDLLVGKIYSIDKRTNPFFRFTTRADYLRWKKAQANS
jgi:hypothetical protein